MPLKHPAQPEIRVGIVGAGAIVRQRHWPGLNSIPGIVLAAVANSSPASASRFLDEIGIAADVEKDWSSLVARQDLDVVWIGVHPNLHRPVTLAALEAGHHVFCQARMARDLQEATQMFEASLARPELVTMLCPPPHGLRHDAWIRQLLRSNAVGEIRSLHLRSLNGAFLDPEAPAHWRQIREISGKNIMTLGIFVEVLQRWFGDIAAVEAQGEIATPIRHGVSIEIPEALTVHASFAKGFPATLEFSCIHSGQPAEDLLVEGTQASLLIDFARETITRIQDGRSEVLAPPPGLDRAWRVEQDFIESVRNPQAPRPEPTFRTGLAYMRVVEAADSALKSGARVGIELPN